MTEIDLRRRALTLGLVGAGAASVVRASPAAGWSPTGLAGIRKMAEALKVAAVIVQQDGHPVLSWGETARPFIIHSMRKSLLSALIGIAVANGEIDLKATLGDLGIDDEPPLSATERSATVLELLQARSGVYIAAAAEAPSMRAARPSRGSHPPGSFWYYNNWDFNALGAIYERQTGHSIFTAVDHYLAKPLGMQDFDPFADTSYDYERDARYPAYPMIFSARDLARFGQLYLDKGRWKGAQIVPAAWVADSTKFVSATHYEGGAMSGYARLWWTCAGDHAPGPAQIPTGAFTAAGAGGHFVTVMPTLGLVVVVRVNTFDPPVASKIATPDTYSDFLRTVIAAHPRVSAA